MEILYIEFSEKININDRYGNKDPKPRRHIILK